MTEKEFHKLRRHDLLQLLVTQMRESNTLQEELDENGEQLRQSQESNDRLKVKLDEKDAQIEKMKGRLDEKDAQIERLKERLNEKDAQIKKLTGRLDEKDARILGLKQEIEERFSFRESELEGFGAIADEMARLGDVFSEAQRATEKCLFNIQQLYEEHIGQDRPEGASGVSEGE